MRRSIDRILTTHCGSLPRPPRVLELVEALDQGRPFDAVELDAAVREATAEAVRRQLRAGLDVVNDGEQSKFSFSSYFHVRLDGFTTTVVEAPATPAAETADFPEFYARRWPFARTRTRSVCTGPIAYTGRDAVERDIANLKAAAGPAGAAELFMSAISPGTILSSTPNEHYATDDEYHEALCDALRVEYEAIADAGIVLQLDCPDLGRTPRLQEISIEQHRRLVARNVELIDYATRTIPPERVRFHVCWGADEAPHHRDPPLADLADLLVRARPQGMTIAAANGRHEHEWRVWEDVQLPEDKILIPGVVDSTTNIVEHPETVAERIGRFAGVLGRERVIAGVDCGLDTVGGVVQVDPAIAYAKLAALSAGAALASERLWR
jgi:5-methyltetrahydropteroyltriglutamate--homocysteine methyltransferase